MIEIAGCGQGGWTLVIKVDGNKVRKSYKKSIQMHQHDRDNTVYISITNFSCQVTVVVSGYIFSKYKGGFQSSHEAPRSSLRVHA